MSNRIVLTYGHKLLREKALPVTYVDQSVIGLLERMKTVMHGHSGIGLAANQIGELLRLVTLVHPDSQETLALVNPVIIECSEEKEQAEEGCLSIPDIFSKIERPFRIHVRTLTPTGKPREIEAEGLLARIIQHEIDHLDGILFIDRLSPVRRLLLSGKLKKCSLEGG